MTETIDAKIKFDNSYAMQLEGFYAPFKGDKLPSPELLKLNQPLADELGLDLHHLAPKDIAEIFSGSTLPKGAMPLAQVYAGHQFGGFSPQLGDGRALLLGEIINRKGKRRDIHLKGSGRTPFSRGGDGKAALGPVLREYIMGEAMSALGVPTTRSLAVVISGEKVMRDELLPGAVLARVAESHLRVGTFQFFSARNETDKVKQLADYAINRHFPELIDSKAPYLGLLCAVRDRQAKLIARWMLLGFVHGVMNTDNMTISGETIDYGPCAFMDHYDQSTVYSSIDVQGRYAYGNQPTIAQWNLGRLAETLLPLIDPQSKAAVELATHEVKHFSDHHQQYWAEGMRTKLGLTSTETNDRELFDDLLNAMEGNNVDYTLLFRELADSIQGNLDKVFSLFDDSEKFSHWHARWIERLKRNPMNADLRIKFMNATNPLYIPRNHKVEEALQAAEKAFDFKPFEQLMMVLAKPYEKCDDLKDYAIPAPANSLPYKTFCGT